MRPDRWLPLLHEIADRADELALRGFRSPRLRVEEKPDHSPVSDVDKAIEEMARALARERHPGLGVFGEEQGDDPGTAGTRLIVDPIDGTVSFVRGIPVFGTLLAIEAEGEVVAASRARPRSAPAGTPPADRGRSRERAAFACRRSAISIRRCCSTAISGPAVRGRHPGSCA